MTTDEIKKQLRDVSFRERQIDALREDVERVLSIATGGAIQYDADRVQTSPQGDGLERKVIQLVGIREKLYNLCVENLNEKLHIMEQLFAMSDERYRQILYRHYVKGENIHELAESMGYSVDHMRRLNKEAIEKAAETWE